MKGHWTRLILQIAILALMAVVNTISHDLFVALVAISIIVLPVATWTVFALLLWTSKKAPDIESLKERVDDALTAALGSTVAGFIGALLLARLVNIITTPIGPLVSVGVAYIIITISIPALSFLQTWRDVYLPMVRRKEREHESE